MTEKTVYALGFFDGVHIGHQALLRECRALARQLGCRAGVVTFLGHPDTLVSGVTPPLINSAEDRKRMLLHYGMEHVVELPFDRAMMTMPWRRFFDLLRLEMGAAGLVCGHDFRFGDRGLGDCRTLEQACREEGLSCRVVPEQKREGITISSTYIRTLIQKGDMEQAAAFLGHPHLLTGRVIHGREIGRTIGIPTANLKIPQAVAVPRLGVYCCRVHLGDRVLAAVTNVGVQPTVGGTQVTVEPWILDFEGDLYGRELTVEFCRFLRPEKKFDSLRELQEEIQRNAAETREYLEKI